MKIRHTLARPLGILALGLVLLGGAFFFTPTQAHAMSLREEINALKATIEDLRTSLGASVYKSTATSATVTSVAPVVVTADISATTVTSLKLGSKGDDVKKLQEKLSALGYYKGVFDGSYGTGTADAVKAYQLANKLTADGSAGSNTLRLLGITLSNSVTTSVKPTTVPSTVTTLPTLTTQTGQACLPGMAPWVRVISPNGGESYDSQEPIEVKWRTCNISSSAQIFVQVRNIANVTAAVLATSEQGNNPNDGIQTFSQNLPGGQYKIRLGYSPDPESPFYVDMSDNFFTINESTQSQGIEVALVNTSSTLPNSDTPDIGLFKIRYEVTAGDDDYVVPKDCIQWSVPNDEYVTFDFESQNQPLYIDPVSCVVANIGGADQVSISNDGLGQAYLVEEGETEVFELAVVAQLQGPHTTGRTVRMVMNGIGFGEYSGGYLNDTESVSFETSYRYLFVE